MPFIQVSTSLNLDDAKKDKIASRIGEVISIIPNKSEPLLMIDIRDNDTMYFGGERKTLAFVDVRCYRSAPYVSNKEFTEAVFRLLQEETSLGQDDIYVSITEYSTWGTKGSMK